MHITRLTPGNVAGLNHDRYAALLRTLSDSITSGIESSISRLLQIPIIHIFIAGDLADPVGSATLIIEPKVIHDGRPAAHLEDVVVRPSSRGKGIGCLLVRHAIEAARANNCYKMLLHTSDGNVAFYEKLGFRAVITGMRLDLDIPPS